MEILHMLRMTTNLINKIRWSQLIGADTMHRCEQWKLVHQATRLQHIVDFVRRCWSLQLLPGQ